MNQGAIWHEERSGPRVLVQ